MSDFDHPTTNANVGAYVYSLAWRLLMDTGARRNRATLCECDGKPVAGALP